MRFEAVRPAACAGDGFATGRKKRRRPLSRAGDRHAALRVLCRRDKSCRAALRLVTEGWGAVGDAGSE